MPYKQRDGRWIIPAGEVGVYALCPESWRLKYLEKVPTKAAEHSQEAGAAAHSKWAHDLEEAIYLTHRVRFVLLLIVAAVLCFMLLGR